MIAIVRHCSTQSVCKQPTQLIIAAHNCHKEIFYVKHKISNEELLLTVFGFRKGKMSEGTVDWPQKMQNTINTIFVLCSENSRNLDCYITLKSTYVHNINGQSTVFPLFSSLGLDNCKLQNCMYFVFSACCPVLSQFYLFYKAPTSLAPIFSNLVCFT